MFKSESFRTVKYDLKRRFHCYGLLFVTPLAISAEIVHNGSVRCLWFLDAGIVRMAVK